MLDLTVSIRDALRQRARKMRRHLPGGQVLQGDAIGLCRGIARDLGIPYARVRAEAIEIGLPDPGECGK